jgi:cysteinyl-tRNA synthetase
MIKLYNSYSRKKETVKVSDKVRIFVCGPTLYDRIHVGNFRVILYTDILLRYFSFLGYKSIAVLNLTDMDVKIIEKAVEEGKNSKEVSEYFYKAFLEDFNKLNLLKSYKIIKTSEYIYDSIEVINFLLKQDLAYKIDNDIYCDLSRSKYLGKLAGLSLEEIKSRVYEPHPLKRNDHDFRLWIGLNDKRYSFNTNLGNGIVGWHLQDFTVINKEFNGDYDIHAGAKELIYPHHEFIMTLGEYYYNKYFLAKYFFYTGLIKYKGEKMSKSFNNCIYINDLLKEIDIDTLKLYILSKKYKKDFEFDFNSLNEFNKIKKYLESVKIKKSDSENKKVSIKINEYITNFIKYFEDDLNIPKCIETWVEFKKFIESESLDEKSIELVKLGYKIFTRLTGVLENRFRIE